MTLIVVYSLLPVRYSIRGVMAFDMILFCALVIVLFTTPLSSSPLLLIPVDSPILFVVR